MMGAREWLNRHPNVAIAGGIVVVLAAIGMIAGYVMASRHHYPAGAPESYFTIDDGQTWFSAPDDNVPPFDHSGVQAVKAYVFQCDGKKFVGYMERFTPQYHDLVLAHGLTPEAVRFGRELKKPGQGQWRPSGDLKAEASFTDIKNPTGGSDVPVEVEP
jgi:hypothetical protein